MTVLELYDFPLDEPEIRAVAALLREGDVFTPSFSDDDTDIYDPLTYRRQKSFYDTDTVILADRNLVTRWVDLLHEDTARSVISSAHRVAAAAMAFAHCANIVIESHLALYEVAATHGSLLANEELRQFRIADNTHVSTWADIALGRALHIPSRERAHYVALHNDPAVDFEMPLRRWRRYYIGVLKIAALELQGGEGETRMSELLRWMYHDFLISGPVLLLGARVLAPNGQRARLLKGLRSLDRERAIRGARNAAWDLVFLGDWMTRVEQQRDGGPLTLLCSRDRAIHDLARSLVRFGDAERLEDEPYELQLLTKLWTQEKGRRLYSQLAEYRRAAENPFRQLHRPADSRFIDDLIAQGEALLRARGPRMEH